MSEPVVQLRVENVAIPKDQDQNEHTILADQAEVSAAVVSKKRSSKRNDVSRQEWDAKKRTKTNVDSEALASADRQPKRKVACLIGYCGTGYHGMQLNPPNETIESTLFEAFVKVGAISADNADDPKKVSFLRAARTDKGVHASVNVISLKMIIEDPDILDKINAELPKQVRVWKILRTMKSFNPRTSCDSRIYEYLLPTSAFLPPSDETPYALKIRNYNVGTILHDNGAKFWTEIAKSLSELEQSAHYQSIDDNDADVGVLALDSSIPDSEKPAAHAKLRRLKLIKQHLIDQKRQYRISPERLQLIRNALDNYQGTRNFHNYTVGQTFDQPNSKRVIKTFTTGEPFLINGTEWVSLKVHGQSFMLHQIRKMVAMVILLVRSSSPISQMASSFGRQKINIPKAPSLGLLLERPIFDVYNRKAGEITDKSNIELGDMDATVTQFKLRHIYDKIYAEEEIENVFHNFISSLDAYAAAGEFNYLFANAPKEEGNKLAAGAEAKSSDSDATSHVAKPTKLGVVSPEALAGNIMIAGSPSTSLMD